MNISLDNKPATIFFACPGIPRIKRGFETFTTECFEALKDSPEIRVKLIKSGGKRTKDSIIIPCIFRKSFLAFIMSKIFKREPYSIEQISFAIFLLPAIIWHKPSIIFFSDSTFGNVLWHIRKYLPLGYKLLYSNGGPTKPPFIRCDYVQQVKKSAYNEAIESGFTPDKQTYLPYGFNFPNYSAPSTENEKTLLRKELSLPIKNKIILSSAALSITHKRIDYLIKEISKLNTPDTFLLLLGEITTETPELKRLADNLLGVNKFVFKSVSPEDIYKYYRASDLFVSTSLSEGFGRSIVEAAASFLPILGHNDSGLSEIIGDDTNLIDMNSKGVLSNMIDKFLSPSSEQIFLNTLKVAEFVRKNFNWASLKRDYIDMFLKTASIEYRK